ncbi:hypothetical protein LJR225_001656 [Phenylobacterium sp. LjRoot225]|uniref:hypothetical protein n=1 Tax=Phenylobacterium sp. LjRoot225 TaxID=3342285 RepID=UPI003ED1154E
MNIAAVTLVSIGLASAASLAVAAPATDVDYLRASRCRGIAAGVGADASAIDAYLKSAAIGRSPAILDRADEEFARAKRQSRGEGKARLQAELSGPCGAYAGTTKAAAVG